MSAAATVQPGQTLAAAPGAHCAGCGDPVGKWRGVMRDGALYHNKRRCLRHAEESARVIPLTAEQGVRLPYKGFLAELARMVAGDAEAALLDALDDQAWFPGRRGSTAREAWPALARMILIGHWSERHPDEAVDWGAWVNAEWSLLPKAMEGWLDQLIDEHAGRLQPDTPYTVS